MSKQYVVQHIDSGKYVYLAGVFEYPQFVDDPRQATVMNGWRAYAYAEDVVGGCRVVEVT